MHHILRVLSYLTLSILLVSCASTEKITIGDQVAAESASHKYEAWLLNNSAEFDAINVLLKEVDALIESRSYDAAADKLERVLRIKTEYAPAWSRLSWLALQTDSPKRSIQMAKRSNSFAQLEPKLRSLNWSFISAASKILGDEESYNQANQKIESLRSF